MSERYNPEEMRESLNGIMECQLEWEAGPDTARQARQRVPSLYAVSNKDSLTLYENIEQMGKYMAQMGQLICTMQRRLDEMEERQAQVTISHAEAKRLQALIRGRADELCRKYNLQDKDSPKIFRAAIKKDLLKRFLVKDLHDLPAAALGRAEALVDSWVNIRLAMERRVST